MSNTVPLRMENGELVAPSGCTRSVTPLLTCAPPSAAVPESNGGLYLTRWGEFNAGAHINAIFRLRCRTAAPLGASQEIKALMADKRHITYFG